MGPIYQSETIIKATGCRSIPADTALLKVLSLLLQRNSIFSLLLFHCKKVGRGRSDIDGADITALKMHLAQKFASLLHVFEDIGKPSMGVFSRKIIVSTLNVLFLLFGQR